MRGRILSVSLLATCLATGLARPSSADLILDQSHFVPAPHPFMQLFPRSRSPKRSRRG